MALSPSPWKALSLLGAAGATYALAKLVRRRARERQRLRTALPVLCFGDSLTEGYHGVWPHPTFGPSNKGTDEMLHVRLHPYSIRLGARLAAASGVPRESVHYGVSLRHAEPRAYSGWTAAELLPRLRAALRGGPWRACVVLAGSNDVIGEGVTAEVAFARVAALHAACDACGVPVIVVTPPDCDTTYHGMVPADERKARRSELSELARRILDSCRRDGRAVVDARAALPMDDGHSELWDDAIHMSPLGSDCLGDAVFAAIQEHGL